VKKVDYSTPPSRWKVTMLNGMILDLYGLDIIKALSEMKYQKRFTTPKGFCIHAAMVDTIEEVIEIDTEAIKQLKEKG